MSQEPLAFDYVLVGGGTAGCCLASRLSQHSPSIRVALVEAGPDLREDEQLQTSLGPIRRWGSEICPPFPTKPQHHMFDRSVPTMAGRMLSGSSSVNAGTWLRGSIQDYDLLAKYAGHPRWLFKNLLPYFCKVETWHNPNTSLAVTGTNGPIHITEPSPWPMTDMMEAALQESGHQRATNFYGGEPVGYSRWTANFKDGRRFPSGNAYDLSKVHLFVESPARRVLSSSSHEGRLVATGVELVDGRILTANREVILSSGAHRTPQILMLSGVGPEEELRKHSLNVTLNLPAVGQNYHDHVAHFQPFKLKNPSKGLAMGSERFPHSASMPVDWVVAQAPPVTDETNAAFHADGRLAEDKLHYLDPKSCSALTILTYSNAQHSPDYEIPTDGSIINAITLCTQPTSRGSITLASADPTDLPIVDPQYQSTEYDRLVSAHHTRESTRLVCSRALQAEVAGDFPPQGTKPLTPDSSDEEFSCAFRKYAMPFNHPGGTAALGAVVDADLKVKGFQNLRVVDASIFPHPLSVTPQATVYAVAELAADLILGKA